MGGYKIVCVGSEVDVNSHPCYEDIAAHRRISGGCRGETAAKGTPKVNFNSTARMGFRPVEPEKQDQGETSKNQGHHVGGSFLFGIDIRFTNGLLDREICHIGVKTTDVGGP